MIIYISNKAYYATLISRTELLHTLAEDKSIICDGIAFDRAYNQSEQWNIFYCHAIDQCGRDRVWTLPKYN